MLELMQYFSYLQHLNDIKMQNFKLCIQFFTICFMLNLI